MRSDKGAYSAPRISLAAGSCCSAVVFLLGNTLVFAQMIKVSTSIEQLPAGIVQFADSGPTGLFLSIRRSDDSKGALYHVSDAPKRLFESGYSLGVTPTNSIVLRDASHIFFARPSALENRGDWIDRTKSFNLQRDGTSLFVSRWGHVFAGGAAAMQLPNGMFQPFASIPDNHTTVRVVGDDSYGNLWLLVSDGQAKTIRLAVRNNESADQWTPVKVKHQALATEPEVVCPGDLGHLWWSQGARLVQFDPQAKSSSCRIHELPSKSRITSIARLADHQVLVGHRDGTVLRIHSEPNKVTATKIYAGSGTIRGIHFDTSGLLWLVVGPKLVKSKSLQSEWHKAWLEQPRMPIGNHDHIFARIGYRLYTAGGKTYAGWPSSTWRNLDHIWSYNMKNETWRVEAPMISPGKSYSGVGELNGELWLMGGYFRVGENGITATDEVEIYDPSTRQIRRGPALPEPRGQVIGATVRGRLYAIGGASDKAPSPQVLSIGKGEKAWRVETDAPKPISQASGCTLGDRVYIAGGLGLLCYDAITKRWTDLKRPGKTTSAPLCTSFRGKIWIMGGVSNGGSRVTQIFDPQSNKWSTGPDIPLPVAWGAAAEVNGQLVIAGGAYFEPRIGRYYNSDRVFRLK